MDFEVGIEELVSQFAREGHHVDDRSAAGPSVPRARRSTGHRSHRFGKGRLFGISGELANQGYRQEVSSGVVLAEMLLGVPSQFGPECSHLSRGNHYQRRNESPKTPSSPVRLPRPGSMGALEGGIYPQRELLAPRNCADREPE